jgi:hypothetical protein
MIQVYYATHNFFLSHRAVYLIVFNGIAPDVQSVEYWLQSVTRMRAPGECVEEKDSERDERRERKGSKGGFHRIYAGHFNFDTL